MNEKAGVNIVYVCGNSKLLKQHDFPQPLTINILQINGGGEQKQEKNLNFIK